MDPPLPAALPAPLHSPSASPSPHHHNHHLSHTQLQADDDFSEKHSSPRHDSRTGHDSVISPFSPKPSSAPSPSASIASVPQQHHQNQHRISLPPAAHLDPEKAAYAHPPPHQPAPSSSAHRSNRASAHDAYYDQAEYHEKDPEDKAWQLLFYLSGPCALLSVAITLWTVFALLASLALFPRRFCTKRPPLAAQITAFLSPALNMQLRLVYSFNPTEDYSAPMLVVIHLFSPVVAFGVAVASWTAAGFWFFSSILGDPGGHDGHNDGKESILGVRNYWERWLSRGLR